MKKICELKEITYGPFFYKDQIILCNNQNDYLFLSTDDYHLLHKVNIGAVYTIDIVDGKIYLYNHDLYIYDDKINDFVICRSSLGGGFVLMFDDHFLEKKYDRKLNEVRIIFYEKGDEKILWTRIFVNRKSFLNTSNHLYLTDKYLKYIDFIDDRTGEVLNTLHFEDPPISRFVYCYNDTLIVSLHVSRDEFHLLGLDARTGEEKWRIKDAFYIYAPDYSTGLFYALSGNLFQVVDVKNGRMVCVNDLSSEMSKFNVIPEAGGCLTGDGIYFRGRLSSKFGLLNIHTHKFEFVEDLGVEEGVRTNDIQYHNGKVYILDSMNVLHIWGKE